MSPEEFQEVALDHALWQRGEGGSRADLAGANLAGADLRGVNVRGADLAGAKLTGAHLSSADLGGANLTGVDLTGADLECAVLIGANLTAATLTGADLSYASLDIADLRHTTLWGTRGNMFEIKSLQFERWPITYTSDRMQIGCMNHSISTWREFSDEEINTMAPDALGWWRKWKEPLLKIIELSPATPTGHEVGAP